MKDKFNDTMRSKRSVTSNNKRAIVQSEIFNPENYHSNMSTKYDRQMIDITEEDTSKNVIKVERNNVRINSYNLYSQLFQIKIKREEILLIKYKQKLRKENKNQLK